MICAGLENGMKIHRRYRSERRASGSLALAAGAVLCALCLGRAAWAQDSTVAAPAPAADSAPELAPTDNPPAPGTVDESSQSPAAPAPQTPGNPELFRTDIKPSDDATPTAPALAPLPVTPNPAEYVSPLQFSHTGGFGTDAVLRGNGIHGGLAAGVDYDDNVFLGNGHNTPRVGAFSYFISPSVSFRRGGEDAFEQGSKNSLAANFNGSAVFFDEHNIQPELSAGLSLDARLAFAKLSLGVTETSNLFNDALVGSSSRTQYRFYNTDFSAQYAWTDKTTSYHDLLVTIASYQTGFDTYNVSSRNVVNHPVTDKLRLGVGVTFGGTFIESSPSQTYQQVYLTADFNNARKLTAQLSIGGQISELNQGNNFSLVFSGSVTDHIFDGTSIQLAIYRNNNESADRFPSGLNNPVVGRFSADYTSTGVSLEATQRLFTRFSVSGHTGFEYSEYFNSSTGDSFSQHFDYFYLGLSLTFPITRWGSFRIGYDYRQDTGTTDSRTLAPSYFNFEDSISSASVQVQF